MNPFEGTGLSFAQPWLLLLLLLIPLISWLLGNFGRGASVIFSSTAPLRALGKQTESKRGFFLSSLLLLALASLILGLARPRLGRSITNVQASGIDIMMALDVSRSMLAEDFTIGGQRVSRIEAVKKVTEEFIRKRPNDRIGIVAFAGQPYLVSPLTLDHDWLLQNLDRLRIGLVEDGTAIGSAIASSASRLTDREAKSKVIVLLTDGENNSGKVSPITAAEAAGALGLKIYTIGAGTKGTAPFPFQDPFGRTVYQNVEVSIDEKTLQQIAEIGHAQYFRATNTASLEAIYEEIDKLEKTTVEMKKYTRYRELFPWFVGAGTGLLALSLLLSETLWRKTP